MHGAAAAKPLVWYEGSGTTERRWLVTDECGSVVAVTDDAGDALAINTYDEYGQPGSGNIGRFPYTGQAWIGAVGLYYYRARFYAPEQGRFLQTDPIGYGDGLNLYGYAGGDPVNRVDPSGTDDEEIEEVIVKEPRDNLIRYSAFNSSSSIVTMTAVRRSQFSQSSQGSEGGRPLTENEIAEARKACADQIDYSMPKIFGEKYFTFQGAETAMAPDGNIYFPLAKGCADLTACSIPVPGQPGAYYDIFGTFIHEMGHVMQHQQGVNALGRGFLLQAARVLSGGLYNPYNYRAGANPDQLNVEAQAQYYRDQYCAANPGC